MTSLYQTMKIRDLKALFQASGKGLTVGDDMALRIENPLGEVVFELDCNQEVINELKPGKNWEDIEVKSYNVEADYYGEDSEIDKWLLVVVAYVRPWNVVDKRNDEE